MPPPTAAVQTSSASANLLQLRNMLSPNCKFRLYFVAPRMGLLYLVYLREPRTKCGGSTAKVANQSSVVSVVHQRM